MDNRFDIIGDVHGCIDELRELLRLLGYETINPDLMKHPEGRIAVFVGDLVNRGPDTPGVLRLIMNMMSSYSAFSVLGNHDNELLSYLKKESEKTKALDASLAQLAQEPEHFTKQVVDFLESLPTQISLDEGKLIIAHAGMKESLQGKNTPEAREFALTGELSGEVDEHGKPVRANWAADYHGTAYVVYGHSPLREPKWIHRTIDIDTGCVYGKKLTALRYPAMALISVKAARVYYQREKPIV